MPLPNPAASRAVLIGSSEYDTLEDLPAVKRNLAKLSQLLTDPDLWGLPAKHVTHLLNPSSRDDVLDAIHQAAVAATDALFVYFAGHGLPERQNSALHLALPSSSPERLFRALPYAEVRREITMTSTATHKVVILDCCYSGQAMDGFMASSLQVADQAQIEGTYLMTASAETALALAVPGEEFTAFTGELVQAIEQGVQQGSDLLDMGTLYFEVRANLMAKNRPEPQERARNAGRSIALLRNRWGRGGQPQADVIPAQRVIHERPEPPRGLESLLRRPPREVLDRVDRLREQELSQTADQLLAAVAGNRADQEVAATLRALARANRAEDAAIMLRAAARRPPEEVAALIRVLYELSEPAIAEKLIGRIATGPIGQVVAVSSLLGPDRPDATRAVLDSAAAERLETRPMIDLIAALWAAGMPDEIDRVLAAATSRMSPAEVLKLADALRTTGRDETAFGLYTHAAHVVARQPHDHIAGIVHAMLAAERTADAQLLVDAAADVCATATRTLSLAEALWAVGHDDMAIRAIHAAAGQLPENQAVVLLDELYAGEHDELVDEYCAALLRRRSPTLLASVVDELHDLGRPVSAGRLLASLGTEPSADTVNLVRALAANKRADDVRAVLDSVLRSDVDNQAFFIATWAFGSEGAEIVDGIRREAREQISANPTTSRDLVEALASGATGSELHLSMIQALFPDVSSSMAGYGILSRSPTYRGIAERLLVNLRQRILDVDAAVELALYLGPGTDVPAGLDSLPRPPYDMKDPFAFVAITRRVTQGGETVWLNANADIGQHLAVEHIVRLVKSLRTRSPEAATKLLQIIAHNRSVKDMPQIIHALKAADMEAEAIEITAAFNRLQPQHVNKLARMLK